MKKHLQKIADKTGSYGPLAGFLTQVSRTLTAIWRASAAAIFGFWVPRAAAQGCAMCYQNAAASGSAGRAALQHGILILLVPAGALFLAILSRIYRSGSRRF